MTESYSPTRHNRLSGRHHSYDALDKAALPTANTVLTCVLLFLASAYYMLRRLNIIPPISPQRLLWDIFVYLTPFSLVLALDKHGQDGLDAENADQGTYAMSRTLGAKSEAMYRILGLDSYGIWAKLQPSRSLTGFGGSSKSGQGLPGLGNWDNSCYQNSIIQGLASLPSVARFLDQAYGSSSETGAFSTRYALKDMIEQLNNAKNSGRRMWIPPALKSMSSWQQQDAQEYYSKVIDALEKEAVKSFKRSPRNAGLSKLKKLDMFRQLRNLNEKSKGDTAGEEQNIFQRVPEQASQACLRNPLEGLIAQRVGCLKCGFVEGISIIPFNCLTLPLDRGWEFPIEDCLDEYTTLEPISGVECANCTLLQQKQQLERLLSLQHAQTRTESESSQRLVSVYASAQTRLDAINEALSESDFSEATLSKKCNIPSKLRVSTTKSRQAVIARAPKSLALHVNRSMFDELSGTMSKNLASVRFPKRLDLSPWCLGSSRSGNDTDGSTLETWETDPSKSMLLDDVCRDASPESSASNRESAPSAMDDTYVLRAVVTHYGRHEDGHYIAYRQDPNTVSSGEGGDEDEGTADWWRLSDEDVASVDEAHVLAQGGVFMLFYERPDETPPPTLAVATKTTNVEAIATGDEAASLTHGRDDDDDNDDDDDDGPESRNPSAAADAATVELDVTRSYTPTQQSSSSTSTEEAESATQAKPEAERDVPDAVQPVVPPMRTASLGSGSAQGMSVAGLGMGMVEAN